MGWVTPIPIRYEKIKGGTSVMEDFGSQPIEPKSVEIWIHRQTSNKLQPAYIADELLKFWDRGLLTEPAKMNVCRYCFNNGFYPSIVRVLKQDLRENRNFPLPAVL